MAPLHRQYKTARTETRCHLLLKIWQMATQTSASRGYVLFDIKMAFMPSVVWCRKGHTQKVLKLSAGLRTQSVECSKLGKTRIIADAATGWLEMPRFLNRMFPRHSTRNRNGMPPVILLISQTGRSAECGSFFSRERLLYFSGIISDAPEHFGYVEKGSKSVL